MQSAPRLASLLLLCLIPTLDARACGGEDPCLDLSAAEQAAGRLPILRSDDTPGGRLHVLLRAYGGEPAAQALAVPEDSYALPTVEVYAGRVRDYFGARQLPVPELPPGEGPGSYGDGVCAGNTYAAAAHYLGALEADPALAPHAAPLVKVRSRMVGLCAAQAGQADALLAELRAGSLAAPQTAAAAGYLEAALLLYTGRAARAVPVLEGLAGASNSWVRETASYLLGRAHLIAAQQNWNGYEDFGAIDRGLLQRSREAFQAYARAYPAGRYLGSARALERRLLFLEQNRPALNQAIVASFQERLEARDFQAIARESLNEVTGYLDLTAVAVQDYPSGLPLVAAVFLPGIAGQDPLRALEALAAQRAAYEHYPGLYELVELALLDAAGRPQALALQVAPQAPLPIRHSFQHLQALAHERAGKTARALALLRQLGQAEPALARDHGFAADFVRLHLASGDFGEIFAAGSPLASAEVAAGVFDSVFPSAVLQRLAAVGSGEGPQAAAGVLLFRHLLSGRYREFLDLYDAAGRPEPFGEVETAARTLAGSPDDSKGLFNTGYFLHVRRPAPPTCCPCERLPEGLVHVPEEDRAGEPPIRYYVRALEGLKDGRDGELEAKVLHHAILCFRQGSAGFSCLQGGGDAIPLATRKGWFQRLKKRYARSSWAQRTEYYY